MRRPHRTGLRSGGEGWCSARMVGRGLGQVSGRRWTGRGGASTGRRFRRLSPGPPIAQLADRAWARWHRASPRPHLQARATNEDGDGTHRHSGAAAVRAHAVGSITPFASRFTSDSLLGGDAAHDHDLQVTLAKCHEGPGHERFVRRHLRRAGLPSRRSVAPSPRVEGSPPRWRAGPPGPRPEAGGRASAVRSRPSTSGRRNPRVGELAAP